MENWERVQELTDAEIVERINRGIEHVSPGISFWYGELERRNQSRSADRAERLTAVAVRLTIANVIVATIAAVAAILALLR